MSNLPQLPKGFVLDSSPQASELPALPAGFTLDAQQPDQNSDWTYGDLGRAALRGVPIAGGLYERNLSPEDKSRAENFDTQHPYISGAAKVGGAGAAMLGTLALAPELGATALGMRGASLGAQALNSAASGAAIGGLDAAARGTDVGTGALENAALGAVAPGVGNLVSKAITPAVKEALPTVDELKNAARSMYNHPEVKAVQIKPQAVSDLRDTIKTDLENTGYRASDQKKTFSAVDELVNPNQNERVASGGPMTVADIDSVRKRLGVIASEKDAQGAPTANAASAIQAINHVNDFLPSLQQPDLLAGNAGLANTILGDARGNWKAAKQLELVNTKAANADLMASSTYGGGNFNNATRQKFRPLLMNDAKKAAGFSDAALADLEKIVKGTFVGNTARRIGKLAPEGPVGYGIHLGGFAAMGPAALAAIPATAGAKIVGDKMTAAAVQKLKGTIAKDSPLWRLNNPKTIAMLKASSNPKAQIILRALGAL